MKKSTKIKLDRAVTVAHLIGSTIETNESLSSTDFLDLDVAVADLAWLIKQARTLEYGL